MKLAAAIVMALLGTAAHAEALERVPVLNLQLDGAVTLAIVRIPPAPTPWMNYVCAREFDARSIRCYLINAGTMQVKTIDLNLD